jgi:drug/metabolite transporter (DMT)-like permease
VSAFAWALVKALVAIVIFGTVPAAVSLIGFNAPALGILRLVMATIGMSAILAARRATTEERPSRVRADFRTAWPGLAAMGVFFGLHWLTYFVAIKLGSPSMSEFGFATYGIQLPLLGWAFGFGRPGTTTVAGIALALAGTCLCLWGVDVHSAHASSLAVGVLSGALYAALPLLHQRYAAVDVRLRTWAQFAFALTVFAPLAPWGEWSWTRRDVLLLLHLGLVVTMVAHYLWVQATTALPIQVTSVVSYLQLPTSLTMNWLLIGAKLTPWMIAGAACVVAANFLTLGLSSHRVRKAN